MLNIAFITTYISQNNMETVLIILPEEIDPFFLLVGEYLSGKAYAVYYCPPVLNNIKQKLLTLTVDYTLVKYDSYDLILAITAFSKISTPQNQFVLKLNSSEYNLMSLFSLQISAYICSSFSFNEMMECLSTLSKGQKYLCKDIKDQFAKFDSLNDGQAVRNKLSKREIAIMNALATGKRAIEIASDLFISINTLHNHKTKIRNKLNLKSNSDLLVAAINITQKKRH